MIIGRHQINLRFGENGALEKSGAFSFGIVMTNLLFENELYYVIIENENCCPMLKNRNGKKEIL